MNQTKTEKIADLLSWFDAERHAKGIEHGNRYSYDKFIELVKKFEEKLDKIYGK